jgi:hypothetical protein
MTSRRLGASAAGRLARLGSLAEAVELLGTTTYGARVRAGQGLAEAQHAVVDTTVWNLRVLAGWAPREGVGILRAMVTGLEIANTLRHREALAGRPGAAAYQLGGLGTAWSRLAATTDAAELRRVLATSPWGDPGDDGARTIGLSMQAVAADRLVSAVPEAQEWAAGEVALLLARELGSGQGHLPDACRVAAARVVGWPAVSATGLDEVAAALPRPARWALEAVDRSEDLWRAEARWWRRVDHDAAALVSRSMPGRAVLVGAVGLLGADAWRVRAALELAARGGEGGEDADAVA